MLFWLRYDRIPIDLSRIPTHGEHEPAHTQGLGSTAAPPPWAAGASMTAEEADRLMKTKSRHAAEARMVRMYAACVYCGESA